MQQIPQTLPRISNKTKRDAIVHFLQVCPELTNKSLAKLCGTAEKTVGKVRAELNIEKHPPGRPRKQVTA